MAKSDSNNAIERMLGLTDKLFRVLLPTVPKELLEMDFTMPQMKILLMLFMYEPMRMSHIAADLGVTLATATGLIDRLVEREIVLRESDPADRRVVLCRLSDTGEKTLSRIWNTVRNRMADLVRTLEASKLESLTRILDTMLTNAVKNIPPVSTTA